MKKQILIIHSNMELGGAETSLLGLMQSIDFDNYDVDLLLLDPVGSLMSLIPEEVRILDTPKQYRHLMYPIKDVVKAGDFGVAYARLKGKWKAKKISGSGYAVKQYAHLAALKYLPTIDKEYDMAISFIDPHYIVNEKVKAKVKLGWVHFAFEKAVMDNQEDFKMWDGLDYIVLVSDSCKIQFNRVHPLLTKKTIVIENVLSKKFINQQSNVFYQENEMNKDDSIKLLSIGRYDPAKNFDNIPFICKKIREQCLDVHWYIIGFGSESGERILRNNIAKAGMEKYVSLIGKKENPYPYIKACDIYVQPSRTEGKCVTVREAQILNKPVVITNYPTSPSQLTDGYDGIVVPMDNEGCANGIVSLIQDKELQQRLVENTKKNDYTNVQELEKLYMLMEE